MHLHLAAPRATAHAEVLERAAEARLLVSLEVRQRDDDVGVGDGRADLGSLAVLEMDGDLAVVRALEAVGDDDVGPDGDTVEAVLLGRLQVIDRVGAASRVQRIAVGQEWLAPEFADQLHDPRDVVGPDVGEIAGLSQVQLERNELVLEVDVCDPGGTHDRLGLVQQVVPGTRAQVGEPYLRHVHAGSIVVCSHFIPVISRTDLSFMCSPWRDVSLHYCSATTAARNLRIALSRQTRYYGLR